MSAPPASGNRALAELAQRLPPAATLRERDARLQALKELVGHLAHDLNNCLAPVVGYVTLLREETSSGSASDQYLSRLHASAEKTEDLVRLLLEATHPERHFSPGRGDLTLLIQRTTETWMKALPSAAQISVETNLAACVLWLDEPLWVKLIEHLLKNAQAAMPKTGTLKLTLQRRELSAAEADQLAVTGTSVFEFRMEDTGCGMTEEGLRRACEPLYSTWPSAAGSGLGLTLAHSIVQLHGGQIAIDSVEEVGTCVRIWIPAGDSVHREDCLF
jgi:signal transduction histidine kinase